MFLQSVLFKIDYKRLTLDIHTYTQFDKPNTTSSEVNMKENSAICDFRHRLLQVARVEVTWTLIHVV